MIQNKLWVSRKSSMIKIIPKITKLQHTQEKNKERKKRRKHRNFKALPPPNEKIGKLI